MTRAPRDDAAAGQSTPAPNETPRDAAALDALRARILAAPELVLEDAEIMQALLRPAGGGDRKILDLRGAQIDRLERRLLMLRQAHRDMVEAAFDNMTGVEQAHEAVLALLEADGAESLAARVRGRLPEMLQIQEARLCLCLDDDPASHRPRTPKRVFNGEPTGTAVGATEAAAGRRLRVIEQLRRLLRPSRATASSPLLGRQQSDRDALDPAMVLLPQAALQSRNPGPKRRAKASGGDGALGPVMRIRDTEPEDKMLFGPAVADLETTAVVRLELGPARSAGALAFGAADPARFRQGGTVELLSFLGGVVERLLKAEDAQVTRKVGL